MSLYIAMMARFSLLVVALAIVSGCGDYPAGRYDVLGGDRTAQVETLLSAAEQGTPEDKYHLGLRYERGMVVRQNLQEAVRWYRLAAKQGYPDAQYKLCELSDRGQGLPQDYEEAMRWCGLAADQGQRLAMLALGRHYHASKGVPRDLVRAHMWYNLASAYGDDGGKASRERLANAMTPAQIAEAHKLAREWNLRMGSAIVE